MGTKVIGSVRENEVRPPGAWRMICRADDVEAVSKHAYEWNRNLYLPNFA
ncbi:hypothetical protein AWT69_002415 [Pseudomonas putida]|nr:hypothetical protein AWT69_002415 [Pseudomonas putida]